MKQYEVIKVVSVGAKVVSKELIANYPTEQEAKDKVVELILTTNLMDGVKISKYIVEQVEM